MMISGTTAAATLCAVSLYLWHGNAATNAAAETDTEAQAASPVPSVEQQIEDVIADNAVCVRWLDPPGTWQQLRATPLGALIPAETADVITKQLAGIDRVEAQFDILSMFNSESELPKKEQRDQARILLLGPEEQRVQMQVKITESMSPDHQRKTQKLMANAKVGDYPGYRYQFRVFTTSEDQRARLQTLLAEQFAKLGGTATASGFTAMGDRAHLDGGIDARGLFASMHPDHAPTDLSWAEETAWTGARDFELRFLSKPRHPEAYAAALKRKVEAVVDTCRMSLWIESGRLRMETTGAVNTQAAAKIYSSCATLTDEVWKWVPKEALAAGALAVRPNDMISNGILQSFTLAFAAPLITPGETAKNDALVMAFKNFEMAVDGHVIGYVDVSGPLPSGTIAGSMPAEACSIFISQMAERFGLKLSDQSTLKFPLGPVLCEAGYHDGHFVFTTDSRGIASFQPHGDDFATQPDVASSMTASQGAPPMAHMVMRTDKIIDWALPMAQATGAVPPEQIEKLRTASSQMREQQDTGWFVMRMSETGMKAEASGAAAFIAGAVVGLQSGIIPKGIN
jgi:hypothetical protein